MINSKPIRIPWARVQFVAGQAQAYVNGNENEFSKIPLRDLRQTDEGLGHQRFNEDFRLVIRNRIGELEQVARDKRNLRSMIISHTIAFISGVAIAFISASLW